MTTSGIHDELTANGSNRRRQTDRANAPDDLDGAPDANSPVGRLRSGASAAAEAIPEAMTRLRDTASTVVDRLPDAVTSARVTAMETADTMREMPEPTRRSLAALSIGLGIGLSLAGAPRLLTMAALTPALLSALVMTIDDRPGKAKSTMAGAA